VSWLLGDRQGSITTTVTAGIPSTRWYLPYGGRRGPTPVSVPTTTGFLGKHEDGSGLTHLEHRDYDPTTGVFITVDPLVASTGDPYSYAAGNPTTLSDPNGLEPSACEMNDSCHDGSNSAWGRQLTKSNACIISTACDGQQLVDAIKFSKRSGLGGIVFGAIDVAYQGDWELHDGNWNPKDLEAAAHGAIAALMTGGAPVATPAIATMIERVAQRLLDNNDLYEQIDDEPTWWDRNGSTVMTTAFITFAVIGMVATGGALAAGASAYIAGTGVSWGVAGTIAGAGTAALHTGNVVYNCVFDGPDCAGAAWSAGVDLATYGLMNGTSAVVGLTADGLRYSATAVVDARTFTRFVFDGLNVGAPIADAAG
jgi:RHS repeat-associated protein